MALIPENRDVFSELTDAVPERKDPERYTLCDFTHSSFVELTSGGRFDVRMQYPLLGMKNAEEKCFMRREVFERLQAAADLLPGGWRFRIWDAWRPFALQEELYEAYSVDIIRDFELEGCTDEQKKAVIRRFVSDPVMDVQVPPVHTTGGAVDLTILNAQGEELAMGTAFDAFTDLTYTAAFESEKNLEVRMNRRLLYHVMTSAGFTNLPSEWWHFDYGDRFWAYYNKQAALYEGVFDRQAVYMN